MLLIFKQNLRKVQYELKLRGSEDCLLVLLKEMLSQVRACNSCICHTGLLSLVDDLLFKNTAYSRFDSKWLAQNEQTQVDQ